MLFFFFVTVLPIFVFLTDQSCGIYDPADSITLYFSSRQLSHFQETDAKIKDKMREKLAKVGHIVFH